MIGSSRQIQTPAETLRAPYASPQPQQALVARESIVPRLVPFVPREFRERAERDQGQRDVGQREQGVRSFAPREAAADLPYEAMPFVATGNAGTSTAVFSGNGTTENVAKDESVSAHFGEVNVEPLASFDASPAETEDEQLDSTDSLPWIDAYAVDGEEAEETWPMGEAGRRLDELTDSLSSLDARRARQHAAADDQSEVNADTAENGQTPAGASAEAPLPMWNEDEWIDIMPTSMHPSSQQSHSADAIGAETGTQPGEYEEELTARPLYTDLPRGEVVPPNAGAELTARALEALAQRIRAGELPVPEAQPEVGQEALLAGVLASMLGWRQ